MLSIIKNSFSTARYASLKASIQKQIADIKTAGTYKGERLIYSPQDMKIISAGNKEVINFCANNYLGLANNKQAIEAAKKYMDMRGCGMASVRFICGTQVANPLNCLQRVGYPQRTGKQVEQLLWNG